MEQWSFTADQSPPLFLFSFFFGLQAVSDPLLVWNLCIIHHHIIIMFRRRHGCQLPADSLQVAVVTVFSLLAIAYYIFLAPFIGSSSLKYVAMALYSPVVLSVLLLYIRCTAIDPSDPGVFALTREQPPSKQEARLPLRAGTDRCTPELSTPTREFAVRSANEFSPRITHAKRLWGIAEGNNTRKQIFSLSNLGLILCGWIVKGDNCRDADFPQDSFADEDVLFCTLCNIEVCKYTKHCRSCDKCVIGFDHHCRWLNNCVGKKNYLSFISLMALSITMLGLECGIGITVLVRFFVKKDDTIKLIVNDLGNGFSWIPFVVIVALCTLVALLASIPLGELFFFHLILMKKGITTYEYVIAMRTQSEAQEAQEGEQQNVPSPTSSTSTRLSGSSTLQLPYRVAWCTPPRVFVEHEDEIIPHLGSSQVPSTVDPDDVSSESEKKVQKHAVRISAWKLSKLNPSEVAQAAAKARERSSVLRPIERGAGNPSSSAQIGLNESPNRITGKSPLNPLPEETSYPGRGPLYPSPISISSYPDVGNMTLVPPSSSFPNLGRVYNTSSRNLESRPLSPPLPPPPPGIGKSEISMGGTVAVNVGPGPIKRDPRVSAVYRASKNKFLDSQNSRVGQNQAEIVCEDTLISSKASLVRGSGPQEDLHSGSRVPAIVYSGSSIFYGGPFSIGSSSGRNSRDGEILH